MLQRGAITTHPSGNTFLPVPIPFAWTAGRYGCSRHVGLNMTTPEAPRGGHPGQSQRFQPVKSDSSQRVNALDQSGLRSRIGVRDGRDRGDYECRAARAGREPTGSHGAGEPNHRRSILPHAQVAPPYYTGTGELKQNQAIQTERFRLSVVCRIH